MLSLELHAGFAQETGYGMQTPGPDGRVGGVCAPRLK